MPVGVTTFQNPLDAQMLTEIIWETRPERIVECGVFGGGTSLMLASHMEVCGIDGRVIGVDIVDHRTGLAREHDLWDRRVTFLHGSTIDSAIVDQVRQLTDGLRTMVILDSDHSEPHVRAELDAYASMVTSGCYLVVQDGIVDQMVPEHGPGPLRATEAFLAVDDRFEVDLSRERLGLTACPSGWLRRR